MVPGAGLEPARVISSLDFKSNVSAISPPGQHSMVTRMELESMAP